MSIEKEIKEAKELQKEYLNELYFVDYCNNCKTGLASKHDIPCHHPWYCWHIGEPSKIQFEIIKIEQEKVKTSKDFHRLKKLRIIKETLIREGLREYRRNWR